MDQKVHILALQKKTYASPRENMDAVRDMLAQYKREKPDSVPSVCPEGWRQRILLPLRAGPDESFLCDRRFGTRKR